MAAHLYKLSISARMLDRGFWLYVWRIHISTGAEVFYVGRTGDSSSLNAQSPFARVSGHLGPNKRANALRRYLAKHDISFKACDELELIAFGPVFDEADNESEHRRRRDTTAALERDICMEMTSAGYRVLNKVTSNKPVDMTLRKRAIAAFATSLPLLSSSA